MTNGDIVPGFDDEALEGLVFRIARIDGIEGGLLISVDGQIRSHNANQFRNRVAKAMDSGYLRLVFDLHGLGYSTSTGWGLFPAFLKAAKSRGGDMVIINLAPNVRELFQHLGFMGFFSIADSLEEARALFGGKPMDVVVAFPRVFPCPICHHEWTVSLPGLFECGECKVLLEIDEAGRIGLG